MAAAAITSVVGLVVATLINDSVRAGKNLDQKSESIDFSNEVSMVTLDSRVCGGFLQNGLTGTGPYGTNNFTAVNFPDKPLANLQMCDQTMATCTTLVDMTAANQNFRSGIKINNLVLKSANQSLGVVTAAPPSWSTSSASPSVSYNRYLGNIQIDFVKTNAASSTGSQYFKSILKPVVMMVDPASGKADMCYGTDSPEAVCRDMLGGVYNSAKTPACILSALGSNGDGKAVSDFGASGTKYSAFFGENPSAPGGNINLYGPISPAITFGWVSTSSLTAPIDSGSGALKWDATSKNITLQGTPNGGNVVLTAHTGTVEIWTNDANAMTVPLTGNITVARNFDMTTHNVINTSDRRAKSDIRPLGPALDKILKIDSKHFTYIEDKTHELKTGYIAQEVQTVIPEVVHVRDDKMLGIDYTSMIPYLSQAIKDLFINFTDAQSDQLKKNKVLEKRITDLEKKLKDLKVRCEGSAPAVKEE